MENFELRKHIDYVLQRTKELGLSAKTFAGYARHYEAVFRYCMENRRDTFMYQDAAAFCALKCRAELKQSTVKPIRKAAYTVARYFETGEFSWGSVTFTTNAPASGAYRELMSDFQQELSKRLSPGTVRPEMIIIRQFLYFLEQAGVEDAHSMVSENVLDFVRQEAPNHKGSMPRLLRTLRNFVQFLRDKGIVDLDADRFLGTAGRCRQKALPCFTDEELQLIFSKIDRSTDKGRRDYAIFLLAVRTGMRASDISGLKLSDICWTEKTIRVVQKKTKVTLLLPLPIDAGNAIADYILHSRPRTDNPYVFVRLLPPVFSSPVSPTLFNAALRGYIEAAGIGRSGWDGKSFHALRRTAGTKMVSSGVPVSTVAQILGHGNIESSKRYISLDSGTMRTCCLDLGPLHTRKEGLV